MVQVIPDRKMSISREITKKYEEVKHGTLGSLLEYYKENPPKGEFVVIVGGMSESVLRQEEIDGWNSISVEEHMKKYTDEGMSKREIYAYLNR